MQFLQAQDIGDRILLGREPAIWDFLGFKRLRLDEYDEERSATIRLISNLMPLLHSTQNATH